MRCRWSWRRGLGQFARFFFKAEAGIRDVAVTGVQTCALPILGVQLGVALDVRHHPQDVPSIPIGEVGSEGRASKVDMATLINVTNLVEERGTIQDAVYVQDCATANGASLRHGEHRDFPFAKEVFTCVSVPPHLQRLRASGFTTIDKKRADRESKSSSNDGAPPNREAPGTFGLSPGPHH